MVFSATLETSDRSCEKIIRSSRRCFSTSAEARRQRPASCRIAPTSRRRARQVWTAKSNFSGIDIPGGWSARITGGAPYTFLYAALAAITPFTSWDIRCTCSRSAASSCSFFSSSESISLPP